MQVTKSRVSLAYVISIIALLCFVSISSYWASINTEAEATHIVDDAIPLANAADNIIADLVNQETGIRGYEVAGDDKFLEPYEEGKAQLAKDLETIRRYESAHPALERLFEIEAMPAINKLQTYYSSQIALIQRGQLDEARKRTDTGKQLMDSFRLVHDKVQAEIQKISDEAYDQMLQAGRLARLIITIGGILAILIGASSGIIFNRATRAETALRKSEETYRFMAESLEAQNEEIIAQQEEQERTLEKLSDREQELETISGYQQRLTGYVEMSAFLDHSVPALLESLKLDAALVVVRKEGNRRQYDNLYAIGYPEQLPRSVESELFGPARRVFTEKRPIECTRDLSGNERGVHQGASRAVDYYYPLLDNDQEAIGFLLLTGYQTAPRTEQQIRLAKGVVHQFGLAFLAQLVNEDRRQQSISLAELNARLVQEKQHMEEQRDLIESILESTHEGMMLCGADGRILFANLPMAEYFKLNERIDHSFMETVNALENKSPSFAAVCTKIEGLFLSSIERLSERFTFKDGEQLRHAELYATRVGEKKHGGVQGFLLVFRDRTEEEKVDQMKNEFVSIVSHELRTPLSSVLGFIEILLHRELPPERQKKYMETIYKEASRLSTLINDFLDLQRMESGRQAYHFVPVEVNGLVSEVVEQWQDKQNHRVRLQSAEGEVWAKADSDRLKQVIHNLLSNAIKYSPQADIVDVRLIVNERKVRLDIQDYGLGIPDDARGKLFSKFYRVDNSDRRQIGGTGLGLAIVKEIVDAHSGTISFDSVMGEGTTFTVELEPFRIPSIGGSIVVLEDDENLAKLIEVAVAKLNIPSVKMRSAEEGMISLERAGNDAPVLCIVDIHLDGLKTGWDFIGELYRHPLFHRTPVIVSTALEPPQDYHERDIEKFLKKPFSMEKLLEVAHQLLKDKDKRPDYVFPIQDERLITNSLKMKGIPVGDIRRSEDTIEIQIESKTEDKAAGESGKQSS